MLDTTCFLRGSTTDLSGLVETNVYTVAAASALTGNLSVRP